MFDEMKIKKGLVYNKHTGHVIGFTFLGDVNRDPEALERRVNGIPEEPIMATQMLSIMIRGMYIYAHSIPTNFTKKIHGSNTPIPSFTGVFTTLKYPYAHFQTKGITGDQLFPIV